MKKKNKKFIWKTFAGVIMIFLLLTSAAQAVVKINKSEPRDDYNQDYNPPVLTLNDDPYVWEDNFDNAQKIDMQNSENYIVEGGEVKMYGTYPMWTDPSFTRMKEMTLTSQVSDSDVAIKVIVNYDSDMRSDYGDVRFKFQDDDYWLDYWIEEKNPQPNDPYAIFWLKLATLNQGQSKLYMFYGNPSATDQSDYWSVFDENSWSKDFAHDQQVTYHWYKEGAWDPDVAWGDGKFLVCWEEGTAYWPAQLTVFQQQIRGRYYDANGNPTSERFDIVDEPDETPPYRYENPSVAYGRNGKFFVAYEAYENPLTGQPQHEIRGVEGAIVRDPQDGVSMRFTICAENLIQADPCVAFDPNHNQFFVVWEDCRQGYNNYDIYGKLYDSNGNTVGSEIGLCIAPNSQCEPWIAFDNVNNHYLVVWEESLDKPNTGPFEIWGQLFDWQGGPLGNAKRISQQCSSSIDYNFPSVAFCELTESYLATWNQGDISSGDWNGYIYGRMLDENGNFKGDVIEIAAGQYCRTNVIPYLTTSFFVVYDSWAGSTGDIWGKMINPDGSVNPYSIQLSDNDNDPCDWPNIGSNGEKIFVTWEDDRILYQSPFNGMPDIYCNVWSLNIPSGSDISCSFGDEKSLVLDAYITSIPITPENWYEWERFEASKSGSVVFDILDAENLNVLMSGVSPGRNIGSITSPSIRLKATFSRSNPSSSPTLDKWSVTYFGIDDDPPRTSLKNIDGIKGLNEYYISDGVTIWLNAQDYPADTGSGIDKTYYTINSGSQEIYSESSGIVLSVSQGSNWQGTWTVNFWSVDKQGNTENNNKPENKITIQIDAERPECWITEPANEQQLEVPFWVRADASDNMGIDRVEFDIEPFGEREGLPYEDKNAPYEWYCDVDQKARILASLELDDPPTTGVNVMVRAQAFDRSGQTWIHELWVYITNWEDRSRGNERTIINNRPILNKLKLGITTGETLDVKIPVSSNANAIKFVATKIFTRKQATLWDNDLSDGSSASFDIPTGFYKITTYAYKEDEQIASDVIVRVFYIAR